MEKTTVAGAVVTMIQLILPARSANSPTPILPRRPAATRIAQAAAAIAGLLALGALAGCADDPSGTTRAAGRPEPRPSVAATQNLCRLFTERPHWFLAAEQAERRWSAPVNVQMAIMYQESAFVGDARPPAPTMFGIPVGDHPTTAYGYSQAINGTWRWYQDSTGRRDAQRTSFDDSTDFIGWYMEYSRETLGFAPNDAYRHYLAYHEGHKGFERGNHRRKGWLLRTARKVQDRADAYGAQLSGCRQALRALSRDAPRLSRAESDAAPVRLSRAGR